MRQSPGSAPGTQPSDAKEAENFRTPSSYGSTIRRPKHCSGIMPIQCRSAGGRYDGSLASIGYGSYVSVGSIAGTVPICRSAILSVIIGFSASVRLMAMVASYSSSTSSQSPDLTTVFETGSQHSLCCASGSTSVSSPPVSGTSSASAVAVSASPVSATSESTSVAASTASAYGSGLSPQPATANDTARTTAKSIEPAFI